MLAEKWLDNHWMESRDWQFLHAKTKHAQEMERNLAQKVESVK